jgi:hypothetical protein
VQELRSYFYLFYIPVKKSFPLKRLPPTNLNIFPTTEKDKQKVEVIKGIGSILKKIYKNLWVSYGVKAAIKTEAYEDETVPIRDLLTPDRSPLYQTQKFISSGAKKVFLKRLLQKNLEKEIILTL